MDMKILEEKLVGLKINRIEKKTERVAFSLKFEERSVFIWISYFDKQ